MNGFAGFMIMFAVIGNALGKGLYLAWIYGKKYSVGLAFYTGATYGDSLKNALDVIKILLKDCIINSLYHIIKMKYVYKYLTFQINEFEKMTDLDL